MSFFRFLIFALSISAFYPINITNLNSLSIVDVDFILSKRAIFDAKLMRI